MNNIMEHEPLPRPAKNYPEDAQAATEAAKFVDNHRFPVATEKPYSEPVHADRSDLKQGFACSQRNRI